VTNIPLRQYKYREFGLKKDKMILRLIMQKIFRSLLFWTLILCACSTGLPATDEVPRQPASPPVTDSELTPESISDSPTLPIPKIVQTLQTPHIDQPPNGFESTIPAASQGCRYQWAYKDIPEINEPLDEAIKAIDPDAKAWATAFGEDCVYADGHATFSAMETDFYIHLTVGDLSDFESFGNWILQAMHVVEGLPDNLIAGSKPGFVEFWFIKSAGEHIIVRVPIQKYRDEANGKSGEELFRLFYTNP